MNHNVKPKYLVPLKAKPTLFWVSVSLTFVYIFFTLQIYFILKHFEWKFAIVPTVLGLLIGLSISLFFSLRQRLQDQNEIFNAIAELAQEFTYYRKIDGHFEYISPAVEKVTGYTAEAFYENPKLFDEIIVPEDNSTWRQHLHEVEHESHFSESVRIRIYNKNNELIWLNHVCSPVFDANGHRLGIRSTNINVTKQVIAERKLQHLASVDELTGLMNRRAFSDALQAAISDHRKGEYIGVFFLDLDRFKHLNDSKGHTFGDLLLQQLGKRFQQFQTEHPEIRISRFGGDEFLIFSPCVNYLEEFEHFALKLFEMIRKPFLIVGEKVFIDASIGISVYPDFSQDFEMLIRHADMAMYQTKKSGSGNYAFYDAAHEQNINQFLKLETRLHEAIIEEKITLHYQPKVNLKTQRVTSVEALARWCDQEEWVPPSEFIPVAEETGQIQELTRQLLLIAAAQICKWPNLTLSFNLSASLFNMNGLANWLDYLVKEAGATASQIEFEITESVFINNPETAKEIFKELKALGYKISLDDFGTGYSSLSYLAELDFDIVKIDASFVKDINQSLDSQAILKCITSLANDMHFHVIAEGVETEDQLTILKDLNVHEGQGYLFAKPLPEQILETFLSTQPEQ